MKSKALFKFGAIAGGIATTINISLYFIYKQIGTIGNGIRLPDGKSLSVLPVILSSFLPSIMAAVLIFGLAKFIKRPLKVFTIIGVFLLLLSFGGPLSIPNLTLGTRISLLLMHLVAGGIIIYYLNFKENEYIK